MTESTDGTPLSGFARVIDELFRGERSDVPPAMEGGEIGFVDGRGGGEAQDSGDDMTWIGEQPTVVPRGPSAAKRLADAVRGYLHGDRGASGPARDEVVAAARAASEQAQGQALADAVEALALAGRDRDGALALARELVSPGVASVLVSRLGAASDQGARRESLIGLLSSLGDEVALAVAQGLKDADDDRAARRAMVELLVTMAPTIPGALEEMVGDADWRVVRNAVHVLGETGGPEAMQHFTSTLIHEEPRVRRETLMALGKVGGEEAANLALMKLEDADPGVRAQAARAVGVLAGDRGLRPLLAQLEGEADTDVVVEIIRGLGVVGDPSAVPALEKRAQGSLFSRPPAQVRVAAYRALAAIGTPKARQLIQDATDDKDPDVRRVAQMAAQSFGGPAGT